MEEQPELVTIERYRDALEADLARTAWTLQGLHAFWWEKTLPCSTALDSVGCSCK